MNTSTALRSRPILKRPGRLPISEDASAPSEFPAEEPLSASEADSEADTESEEEESDIEFDWEPELSRATPGRALERHLVAVDPKAAIAKELLTDWRFDC